MKRFSAAVLLAGMLVLPRAGHAGVYGDDLSKCLVKATSDADKRQLIRWIFYAISLNPDVASMTDIPATERESVDRATAALFERLLTDACRAETQAAVKYEGTGAIGESFKLLGQVATKEIMTNPAVAAGTAAFSNTSTRSAWARCSAPRHDRGCRERAGRPETTLAHAAAIGTVNGPGHARKTFRTGVPRCDEGPAAGTRARNPCRAPTPGDVVPAARRGAAALRRAGAATRRAARSGRRCRPA